MTATAIEVFAWVLIAAVAGAVGYLIAQARTRAEGERAVGEAKTAAAKARSEAEHAGKRAAELQQRLDSATQYAERTEANSHGLHEQITRLETERATFDARIAEFDRAQAQLKESFQALSAEALHKNNDVFLQLARNELEKTSIASQSELEKRQSAIQTLVEPIREQLAKYDTKLAEIEKERVGTTQTLSQRLEQVVASSDSLRQETQRLAQSLRAPSVRGRWGEIQLQRVVELAGMLEYCDFTRQESVDTENGRLRPDMTIRLPNEKVIVVDAKTPLLSYLESIDAPEGDRRRELVAAHARQIRTHVEQLGRKNYWEQFGDASPEFVVLFLPGEVFFSAALEQDPSLLEKTFADRVIIATPTTLIALLKAVAFGWRQEKLTRNALEISKLGKDLYERLSTFGGHFNAMAKGLEGAVGAYNKAIGSLDARVMVAARKFAELGVSEPDGLGALRLIETNVRGVGAEELYGGDAEPHLPS